ncbi:MAG: isochorismate synthase [Maribacter sp.]|jgi:isochorismate synthase
MIHDLKTNNTFAIYRLPNEEHHYLLRSENNEVIPFDELGDKPAFVFHPFEENEVCPALAIPSDNIYINPKFSFRSDHKGDPYFISEAEYIPLLEDFVDYIEEGNCHKAICSRIIKKEMMVEDLYPLFIRLKEQYPFAFIYLVNIPNLGCWMGATPEILLTDHDKIGETVALAGTRPLSSEEDWDKKEVVEQQMVERYMANILINRKKSFQKIGPFTVKAGRVMHLKTKFRFPLESNWKDVAMDIHPSPAVCGLPKEKAKTFILKTEPHERGYYCGFLGPVNMQGKTDLYVNLRCMQVFNDTFALYVGGGITSGSVPHKELNETTWKSRTLSDIIEEVYCEPVLSDI